MYVDILYDLHSICLSSMEQTISTTRVAAALVMIPLNGVNALKKYSACISHFVAIPLSVLLFYPPGCAEIAQLGERKTEVSNVILRSLVRSRFSALVLFILLCSVASCACAYPFLF